MGQASPHPLLVPRSGTDYHPQHHSGCVSHPSGNSFFGVSYLPTAHTQSSFFRGCVATARRHSLLSLSHSFPPTKRFCLPVWCIEEYVFLSKKIKQALLSYKTATFVTSFNCQCCLISFDTHIHFVRYTHSHRSI